MSSPDNLAPTSLDIYSWRIIIYIHTFIIKPAWNIYASNSGLLSTTDLCLVSSMMPHSLAYCRQMLCSSGWIHISGKWFSEVRTCIQQISWVTGDFKWVGGKAIPEWCGLYDSFCVPFFVLSKFKIQRTSQLLVGQVKVGVREIRHEMGPNKCEMWGFCIIVADVETRWSNWIVLTSINGEMKQSITEKLDIVGLPQLYYGLWYYTKLYWNWGKLLKVYNVPIYS